MREMTLFIKSITTIGGISTCSPLF